MKKEIHPPRLAQRLFEWYCDRAYVEDLKGDMEEWFYTNIKEKSVFKARTIYWKQIISLIFSYTVQKRKREIKPGELASNSITLSMLENYLKVAVRNIVRQKYFSIVNVVGLSIGMSIGLLMIAMYSYVSQYDNFHSNKKNIYRVISERTEGIEKQELASAPAVLAERLKTEFSGIEKIVRINSTFFGEVVLEKQNIPLRGYYSDPAFFDVFSFEMLEGNKRTALIKPNSMVLTESAAKKISNNNLLGKTLELNGLGVFEVTGIMRDHPKNTHMKFEVLISYSTLPPAIQSDVSSPEQWKTYYNQYIYLLLPEANSTFRLGEFLSSVSKEMYPPLNDVKVNFHLQNLTEITPGLDLGNSIGPKWDSNGFIIFGIITLLILLPACFNYTNISMARALKRSKEIGLRKTMGSLKNQIFVQFITETVVITLISLFGAFLLFTVIRSEFQSMLVEASALDLRLTASMVGWFLLFAIFSGLVAGALPAIYFSGLNPIQALKGQATAKMFTGMRMRKGLTIFQFFLSFCFIICLVGFSRQYRYSLNFDFGFQKENLLDVELQGVNPSTFSAEFSKLSSVQSLSMSSGIMGISPSNTWAVNSITHDSTETYQFFVDENYVGNLGLKLVAGKNFPKAQWQREQYLIVNEEFLKVNKIENAVDAIGMTYEVDGNELEIIAVLKNFHFASLQVPIRSFFFRMDPSKFNYANMKVAFDDNYSDLTDLEKVWNTLSDNRKFHARFFDDEINDAYNFYKSLLKIVGFLGLLAISISLLGLLGMVVYTSENRIREVGIRKVMGASTMSITFLLSTDYLKLMLFAAIIAIPVTTLLFDKFLSSMQYYSITLSTWDVLLSLTILLTLGLATIASQTYKTACANPADTLKCE